MTEIYFSGLPATSPSLGYIAVRNICHDIIDMDTYLSGYLTGSYFEVRLRPEGGLSPKKTAGEGIEERSRAMSFVLNGVYDARIY